MYRPLGCLIFFLMLLLLCRCTGSLIPPEPVGGTPGPAIRATWRPRTRTASPDVDTHPRATTEIPRATDGQATTPAPAVPTSPTGQTPTVSYREAAQLDLRPLFVFITDDDPNILTLMRPDGTIDVEISIPPGTPRSCTTWRSKSSIRASPRSRMLRRCRAGRWWAPGR
jgi:hypothetical protein